LIKAAAEMMTDGLPRAVAIANAVVIIASAIKAWGESTIVIRDYTSIASQTWDDIASDFHRGLDLMHLMLADALVFLDMATDFDEIITKASAILKHGLEGYSGAITGAASTLNGTIGQVQGGGGTSASFTSSAITAPNVSRPFSVINGGASSSAGSGGSRAIDNSVNFNNAIFNLNGTQQPAEFGREFARAFDEEYSKKQRLRGNRARAAGVELPEYELAG
jgi:hypothetical protein